MAIENRMILFKDRDKMIELINSFHDDDAWLTIHNDNKLCFGVKKYDGPFKKFIFTFSKNAEYSFAIFTYVFKKGKLNGRIIKDNKRKTFLNEKMAINKCYVNKDEFNIFCCPYNRRRFHYREWVIFSFTNLEYIEIADIDESEVVDNIKMSK